MSNLIRSDRYIFVEQNANHNKLWYIEEYDNSTIKTIWGRVGSKMSETIKSFSCQSAAERAYDKTSAGKIKKGYEKLRILHTSSSDNSLQVNTSLEDIALKELDYNKSNKNIIDMIKVFCKANIHNITSNTSITYNADSQIFQTPAGIITLEALDDARYLLTEIYDLIEDGDNSSDTFIKWVEKYCRIIPQKVSRKFNASVLFPNLEAVRNQNSVIDSLVDSIEFIEEIKKKPSNDKQNSLFNTSIEEIIDKDTLDYINKKYNETKSDNHSCKNLKVKRVYKINVAKMTDKFNDTLKIWKEKKIQKREMKLWHGTMKQNIISILKGGLVIPPANAGHCTGRMFSSDGIYLSDQSTKSLNYAYGYWSGKKDTNCYMFLCDALMGNGFVPKHYSDCNNGIPQGYNSIFAKAKYSGVQNNEMVVPIPQVAIRFLVEFGE